MYLYRPKSPHYNQCNTDVLSIKALSGLSAQITGHRDKGTGCMGPGQPIRSHRLHGVSAWEPL